MQTRNIVTVVMNQTNKQTDIHTIHTYIFIFYYLLLNTWKIQTNNCTSAHLLKKKEKRYFSTVVYKTKAQWCDSIIW